MKIQLKRSNVLDNGVAKEPTAGQMKYGEFAVNYNADDPAIFLKDSNDNIVRIAGSRSKGGLVDGRLGLTSNTVNGEIILDVDLAGGDDGLEFVNEQLKASTASETVFGSVKIGEDLNVSNGVISGRKPVIIEPTIPSEFSEGYIWFDSTNAKAYIAYKDPNDDEYYVNLAKDGKDGSPADIKGGDGIKTVLGAEDVTVSVDLDPGEANALEILNGKLSTGYPVIVSPTQPDFKAGYLWFDSTHANAYVGYKDPSDDEYWINISKPGPPGPASTPENSFYTYPGGVEQSVQKRLEQYVSVKDFGAVGDGTTDDTAAIQTALDTSSTVYFPKGEYKLTTTLLGQEGADYVGSGSGSILKMVGPGTSAAPTILYFDQKSKIKISGLFFQGDNTGLGSDNYLTGGGAISFLGGSDVEISGNYFNGFGVPATQTIDPVTPVNSCSIIAGTGSSDTGERFIVTNNVFLENSYSISGADCALGGQTKHTVFSNNISVSAMDAMHSLASINTILKYDNVSHIIEGNICFRNVPQITDYDSFVDSDNQSRHGFIISYGGAETKTTVANNIIIGPRWTGIYMNPGSNSGTFDVGGAVITGNQIYYAGGCSNTIGGGIYVGGDLGSTITGNLLSYIGYNLPVPYPEGDPNEGYTQPPVPRVSVKNPATPDEPDNLQPSNVSGIRLQNPAEVNTTTGNSINDCTASAISIKNFGDSTLTVTDSIIISSNSIRNKFGGIGFQSSNTQVGGGVVKISDNLIKLYPDSATTDIAGISATQVTGGLMPDGFTISDNLIEYSSDESGSANDRNGLNVQVDQSITNGNPFVVQNNVIKNSKIAINVAVNSAGTGNEIGEYVIFKGNTIRTASTGIAFEFLNNSNAIVYDNIMSNVTTAVSKSGSGSTAYEGTSYGSRKKVFGTNPPNKGAWIIGDTVYRTNYDGTNNRAWVCKSAGTPGTWQDIS